MWRRSVSQFADNLMELFRFHWTR